jgi:hydrogenase maturation protease
LNKNKIIIYGFGNPGRQDDGLGPAIISRLEEKNIPDIKTECNYQLNIEDALLISEFKIAIFVDASVNCEEPFSYYEIEQADEITFTTHSMSPQSVLALCNDLYNKNIKSYVLEIRGYEWEMAEGLSPKAQENFEKAYGFLKDKVTELL